jgi:sugar lactone lactonase YvrE
MTAECILDGKCTLGEGPVWHDGKLFFIDIEEMKLIRFDPANGEVREFNVGERVGCALPTVDGDWLLGLNSGIARFSIDKDAMPSMIKCPADHDPATTRFNDGKTDPTGRAYMGTMGLQGQKKHGKLYRVDTNLTVTKVVDEVTTSNGLSWNEKLGVMYYLDTPTRKIDAFDWCAETGEISNRHVVMEMPEGTGYPDGHCIDTSGNLWIGMWGGGAILCVDPKAGKVIEKIDVAAQNVTSCCFGGPKLDQLYITTARIGTGEEKLRTLPQAGGVFRSAPGVRGFATTPFGAKK